MKKSIVIIILALLNIALTLQLIAWRHHAYQWKKASDGWQENAMKSEKVANDLILVVKDAQKIAADAVAEAKKTQNQMFEIMTQVDNYRSIPKSP